MNRRVNGPFSGAFLASTLLLSWLVCMESYFNAPQPPGAMLRGIGSQTRRWESSAVHRIRRRLESPAAGTNKWDIYGDFEGPWLLHVKGSHRGGDITKRVMAALGCAWCGKPRYVPHDTLLVVTTRDAVQRARADIPEIAWAGPLQPHHKVDPGLYPLLEDVNGSQGIARRKLLSRGGRLELVVMLSMGVGGREVAKEWRKHLKRSGVGGSGTAVRAASDKKVMVSCDADSVSEANLLAWIAQQPHTIWVEKKELFSLRNKWAKGVMQSGQAVSTPLWDKGIQGQGQVVGIADTGIQSDSCYFYDAAQLLPLNELNTKHRKIIYYRYEKGWGSTIDEEGHGSHTSGSIAGDAAADLPQAGFNGMAPKAKLFFDDIYINNELSPPDDLEAHLFPLPYQHGAKVRSESWGGTSIFYTASAMEVDSFAFHHREFLMVWAGGNDGHKGMFSIGSPATGKNMLSVGAQYSTAASLELQNRGVASASHLFELKGDNPEKEPWTTEGLWANFGRKTPFSGAVRQGFPTDGCEALTNAAELRGKIVLLQRGICGFIDKAVNSQAAGVIAMIVADTPGGETVIMGGNAPQVTIPCMSVASGVGNKMIEYITAGGLQVVWESSGPDLWQEHLASFSAKGPTGDGRTKPEVLTVGADIWSASKTTPPGGKGTCGPLPPDSNSCVRDLGGTSMAAPVAAGGGALMRQYFVEGWFPTGKKVAGNGWAPSGALLRAVMMNSGRPLGGSHDVSGDGTDRWEALDTRLPNNQQGWGSLRLETSLFFDPPTQHSAKNMFVRDDIGPFATSCLTTGSSYSISFDVRGSEPLRVMLAWTDPPATLVADVVLVNDLDLRVHSNVDSKLRWGNRMESVLTPGGVKEEIPDRINNHELVAIQSPSTGTYTVSVLGHLIPEGPQCFALVVTGDFDELHDSSGSSQCPGGCGDHGNCTSGECVCHALWTGVKCDTPVEVFSNNMTIYSTVWPYGWHYFGFDLGPHQGGKFDISFTRMGTKGDPDLFIIQGSNVLPDLLHWSSICACPLGQAGTECGCREMSCDVCDENTANKEHKLEASRTLNRLAGIFITGITGFCCEPAEYRLTIALYKMGCDNVLDSGKVIDDCGICGGPGGCVDCTGELGGNLKFDVCGVCGGSGDSCVGCDGKIHSGLVDDECGVCGGDNSTCIGCDNIPNSNAVMDQCGVCKGDDMSCAGCDGTPNSGLMVDGCGVCGGNHASCAGCDGVPYSGNVKDACGVCRGDNLSCTGCDGKVNSGKTVDACGVCGGQNGTCSGCDGVAYSGVRVDRCGICGGDGKVCLGCDGLVDSRMKNDTCGICAGDNSTCLGCDGIPLSGKVLDRCGVCGGTDMCVGCDGKVNSGLQLDRCKVCNGNGYSCVLSGDDSALLFSLLVRPFSVSELEGNGGAGISKLQKALSMAIQVPYANISFLQVIQARRSASFTQTDDHQGASIPSKMVWISRQTGPVPSSNRVIIETKVLVGALGGEVAERALRLTADVGGGALDRELSILLGKEAKITLHTAPHFVLAYIPSDVLVASSLSSSNIALGFFAFYLVSGGALNWSLWMRGKRGPPKRRIALLLWATYGPLGAHRFYTRTPKVGALFFLTLGVCGVGWLADLYFHRHLLFRRGGQTIPSSRTPKLRSLASLKKLAKSNFKEAVRKNRRRGGKHQRYERGLEGSDKSADDEFWGNDGRGEEDPESQWDNVGTDLSWRPPEGA